MVALRMKSRIYRTRKHIGERSMSGACCMTAGRLIDSSRKTVKSNNCRTFEACF